MNAGELIERTLRGAGEDPASPVFYKSSEALAALNEAERIFCILTLCLETAGGFTLTEGEAFQDLRTVFPHIIAPLRVSQSEGIRLRPATLPQLDALGNTWQAETGDPLAYTALGPHLLAIYPHPDEDDAVIDIIFAREPAPMLGDNDTPKIPQQYHAALIYYAVPRLRAKEGGDEFMSSMWLLERFLDQVSVMGNYVRERAVSMQYDVLPFEMTKQARADFMKRVRGAARKFREQVKNGG